MKGKITKIYISDSVLIEHISGTDSSLNNPNGSYGQDDCFIPVLDDDTTIYLYVGDRRWYNQTFGVGPSGEFEGSAAGTTWGTVKLVKVVSYWNSFAPSTYNGIQRIWFPGSSNDDMAGGYLDFYYNRDAWYAAFNGESNDIVFTLDSSVYKGSVLPENLVVDGFGNIGKAGDGNYIPSLAYTQNNKNNISDEIISISKHGEHITL